MGSQIYNHERCQDLFKPTNWMGMGTITSKVLSFGENVFILALQQHICLFSYSYFCQDLSQSSLSSFTHNVVHVPFSSSFYTLTYYGFHAFVSVFPLGYPLTIGSNALPHHLCSCSSPLPIQFLPFLSFSCIWSMVQV